MYLHSARSVYTSSLAIIFIHELNMSVMVAVELGRRYFPNCSQVLDKFLEDGLPDGLDAFQQQSGTPDEQQVKKMRFCEVKEDVRKAYSKDTADNSMFSALSSNSSSSAMK